ncbi:uncharacterized protein LOC124620253, partial [Schistocerca americana]|uniref:uncharacterized protein LOC124620253 n=1 Tax=Schistocerca americana TaxID=7009 RepID=UPI001F4F2F26
LVGLASWPACHAKNIVPGSYPMFSVHNKPFIGVGYLALCDNYIRKRVLMRYETPRSAEIELNAE